MAARFCAECGSALRPDVRFCPTCGASAAPASPAYDMPAGSGARGGYAQPTPLAPPAVRFDALSVSEGGLGRAIPAGKGVYIGELIKFGWRTTTGRLGLVIGLFLLGVVVLVLVQILSVLLSRSVPGIIVAFLLSLVINSVVSMGWIKVALKLVDGEPVSFGDLFSTSALVLNYLGASILFGVIVTVGFILFVVPGVLWGLRFGLYPFLVVDQGMGPIAALKGSSAVTSGARWDLFGLYFISLVVVYIGVLSLLVGLLVAVPVVALAWALAYRRLLEQTGRGALDVLS